MKIQLQSLFFLFALLQVTLSTPVGVKLPTEDDFYTYSGDLDKIKPGTILKTRNTPSRIRSIYFPVNVKNSWQMLVRSTDSHDNPNVFVTTVIEPYNGNSSKLLAYQTAEDSSSPNCAPSYAFSYGAKMSTVTTQAEMLLIQIALDRGWYVVSPDYEGSKATFTAGRQSGHATLDSIRAALKSGNLTNIDPNAQVGMFGYSGGSLASGHALELQPTYAKDLKKHLIGAALGGFVTNVTATAVGVEGTLFAGLTASALGGLVSENDGLRDLIDEQIMPGKNESFSEVFKKCMLDSITSYAFQNFFTGPYRYVKDGWKVFEKKIVKDVVNNSTLALHSNSTLPEVPIMIFHGYNDTIVPYAENSLRVAKAWCDRGIKSLELNLDMGGHITEIFKGIPSGFAWLERVFSGEKPHDGCKFSSRESNLDYPGVNSTVHDLLISSAELIFGFEIGPDGEHIERKLLKKRQTFLDLE